MRDGSPSRFSAILRWTLKLTKQELRGGETGQHILQTKQDGSTHGDLTDVWCGKQQCARWAGEEERTTMSSRLRTHEDREFITDIMKAVTLSTVHKKTYNATNFTTRRVKFRPWQCVTGRLGERMVPTQSSRTATNVTQMVARTKCIRPTLQRIQPKHFFREHNRFADLCEWRCPEAKNTKWEELRCVRAA